MIVTPFGDLVFGDDKGIKPWIFAHDQRHRTELSAIGRAGVALPYAGLTEKIDSDWFGRHLLYHLSTLRYMPTDDSASAQLLEMEWNNAQNFQVWHQMHNNLHSVLGKSLGISNAT